MKRNFFDTGFALHAGLSAQTSRVLKYLVENRGYLLSVPELMAMVNPIRSILRTPIAECFNRMISSDGLHNFASLYIPSKSVGVPESLSTASLTLDIKQMSNASSVSSVPQLRDKVIVNITPMVKADRATGGYAITSIDNFQAMYVRGQLVASYNDDVTWLPAITADYLVKTYSMILSGLISRYYSLSLIETMRVAGIFALMFCQLLDGDEVNVNPPLFSHCTYIGSRADLTEMSKAYASKSKDGLTLIKCCELISELGIERMSSFGLEALLSMCQNLGPDLLTSQIALEYPPYWMYIIILALSGNKIQLIYQLNAHKLTQEGSSKWLQSIYNRENIFASKR